MFEKRTAVESNAGYAGDGKINGDHISFLAAGIIARRAVDSFDGAVGEGLGVEASRSLGVLVVPKADCVLGHGFILPVTQESSATPF